MQHIPSAPVCTEPDSGCAVVIGGTNIDIAGISTAELISGDSNPGTVRFSPGGVARNIAENLARLGAPVRLLTVFGSGPYAEQLKRSCTEAGVDISAAEIHAGSDASVYLSISDRHGEMQLAVSDMRLYDALTPDYLAVRLEVINRAAVCVADTNIPEASLAFLAHRCAVPLFIDPVSVTKAAKIKELLPYIHTIKPNRAEAEFLTRIPANNDASLQRIADAFLQQGIRQVVLSLGAQGLFCADAERRFFVPPERITAVNTTGAGDSLLAGLAWGFMHGLPFEQCARAGSVAAGICIESPLTVSPAMSSALLCRRAGISVRDVG